MLNLSMAKKSYMHIYYLRQPKKAHSFIQTNGKTIQLYKFPDKFEVGDMKFLRNS